METSATRQMSAQGVSPADLFKGTFSFAITQILIAAVELDLFTAIDRGGNTLEDLTQQTFCSPRGLRILLNALSGSGYLVKQDGRYTLTPVAATYLSRNSPRYAGGMVLHSKMLQDSWEHLAEVVRTGRIRRSEGSSEDRGEFFSRFVDSLYAMNSLAAEVVARSLWNPKVPSPCHVLDVGAGSGVWSLALAREVPHAKVTVAEWPVVIDKVTRKFVARENMVDRYTYLPGNFHQTDFGESAYDAAYLGHICHSEGALNSRRLFQRLHRALRPGGRLVVADMVPDEERCETMVPLLFAVNMLVNTDEGDTFTFSEYRQWLEEAGFGDIQALDLPSLSPVIVATRM